MCESRECYRPLVTLAQFNLLRPPSIIMAAAAPARGGDTSTTPSPSLTARYAAWVRANAGTVAALESAVSSATWLLPDRFAEGELGWKPCIQRWACSVCTMKRCWRHRQSVAVKARRGWRWCWPR